MAASQDDEQGRDRRTTADSATPEHGEAADSAGAWPGRRSATSAMSAPAGSQPDRDPELAASARELLTRAASASQPDTRGQLETSVAADLSGFPSRR